MKICKLCDVKKGAGKAPFFLRCYFAIADFNAYANWSGQDVERGPQ